MSKTITVSRWYDQRHWAVLLGLLCLVAAYGLGSHALDTGSLQQYFLTLVLVGVAVNRFVRAMKSKRISM